MLLSQLAARQAPWVILTCLLVGVVAAVEPSALALIVAVAAALATLLIAPERVVSAFCALLVVLLIGYAFIGRGFAYAGLHPLYIGEVALALSVLVLVHGWTWRLGIIHWALLAFVGLGALRTAVDSPTYGLDAFRDAVTWAYAIFALAVCRVLTQSRLTRVVSLYRFLVLPFITWTPIFAAVALLFAGAIPSLPGSPIPLLVFKGGDVGVHLAGALAFVIVGLYGGTSRLSRLAELAVVPLWLTAAATVAAINRGGLIAASIGILAMSFQRMTRRWVGGVLLAILLVSGAVVLDPVVDLGYQRPVSIQQIATNLVSVVTDTGQDSLQGTKDFRLRWWRDIMDYTVFGSYFWSGKGFGVNLADDDGYQVTADRSLRAPHNSHITVLARMGVPGALLWIFLQLGFALQLLKARRILASEQPMLAATCAWLLVYWLAMTVNAAFDPFLEGPQGGIWFWSVFGAGLALIQLSEGHVARQS